MNSQYLKVQSLLSETLLERRARDKPLDSHMVKILMSDYKYQKQTKK